MKTHLLSCKEIVELVTDYLEDRMSVDQRLEFEYHIAVCGPCRDYLLQMRETVRLTGALNEETISPEAQDTLMRAFRDWSCER